MKYFILAANLSCILSSVNLSDTESLSHENRQLQDQQIDHSKWADELKTTKKMSNDTMQEVGVDCDAFVPVTEDQLAYWTSGDVQDYVQGIAPIGKNPDGSDKYFAFNVDYYTPQ